MSFLDVLFGLQGKTALVTGGSRGIGKEIALGLANAGANLAITSVPGDNALGEVGSEIEQLGRQCVCLYYDIADADAARKGVEDAAAVLGGIDILVNNAGWVKRDDILTVSVDDWNRVMDINLTGALVTAQGAARIMVERGGGKIVNMCSIGSVGSLPRPGAYDVSKAGLQMLTKDFAVALAGKGVGVNAIAPGFLETEMTEVLRRDAEWMEKTLALTPQGRLGRPEEIVGAVIFLASAASNHIHGATIFVDGGRTAMA